MCLSADFFTDVSSGFHGNNIKVKGYAAKTPDGKEMGKNMQNLLVTAKGIRKKMTTLAVLF